MTQQNLFILAGMHFWCKGQKLVERDTLQDTVLEK